MARRKTKLSSEEIEALRERASKAIASLKPADRVRLYEPGTTRTKAGYKLPEYYLVYFLLVELNRSRTDDSYEAGLMNEQGMGHRHTGGDQRAVWRHFAPRQSLSPGLFRREPGSSDLHRCALRSIQRCLGQPRSGSPWSLSIGF